MSLHVRYSIFREIRAGFDFNYQDEIGSCWAVIR